MFPNYGDVLQCKNETKIIFFTILPPRNLEARFDRIMKSETGSMQS